MAYPSSSLHQPQLHSMYVYSHHHPYHTTTKDAPIGHPAVTADHSSPHPVTTSATTTTTTTTATITTTPHRNKNHQKTSPPYSHCDTFYFHPTTTQQQQQQQQPQRTVTAYQEGNGFLAYDPSAFPAPFRPSNN
ncbi:hypothetical protein BDF20DRAFT_865934 [Mycotypha africana]|uniref:uncharacterized protein n=1 Tax=Mycotypha africana TaxID=64632 RepID=UPI0023016E15|nr:uncharacterized protein BDF20DRAFT_865934 [Mycotypha africana]KAI8982265.1 hypothetical protein BDF20DRAFT_865934 [Mycotypha africana]